LKKLWKAFPVGLIVGLIANYLTYRASLFLLDVPKGTAIRPMFEGAFMGLVAMAAFIVGAPLSIWDIRRGWRLFGIYGVALGAIGLLLNLTPWPFGEYLWDRFLTERHIMLEP
jgi:hypothetical protein